MRKEKTMWTKKQSTMFKTPNYSKEYIRKPYILNNIGNLKGKKILEIGCGSGYWTRLFAKRGAICTGIELEETQIKIAVDEEKTRPLGIKYYKLNAKNLNKFPKDSFDIVFLEYVLLEIPSISDLKKIFKEAYKVLKKGGKIFISEMHPFDPITDPKGFKLSKNFNYFSSGGKIKPKALQLDGKFIYFTDYHWTLEDYSNCLTAEGFLISGLREPRPSEKLVKKIPYLKYRRNIVKDLIIEAKKI